MGSVLALRPRRPSRLGVRRHGDALRHDVHDGGRLYARQERSRARRRALRVLPPAHAGDHRPDSLQRVLHPWRDRAYLRRLLLRRRFLAHRRPVERHRRRPAGLSGQDSDPDRRRHPPGAGHRRDHPLHHLPQAGLLALARAGRRGSRRRQAEGNGARGRAADAMKIRRELWFGFTVMALIVTPVVILTPWANLADAHLTREDLGTLGLLMLALVVVAIMLGFPTAFTLMGMGVFFAWLAYRSVNPALAANQTLDLMVQRTYAVMSNDVLIAIPLFVFMGYLVERAAL